MPTVVLSGRRQRRRTDCRSCLSDGVSGVRHLPAHRRIPARARELFGQANRPVAAHSLAARLADGLAGEHAGERAGGLAGRARLGGREDG